MTDQQLGFDNLWTAAGWRRDVRLATDATGRVRAVDAPAQRAGAAIGKYALPGMVNAHSHAFQRAMAGRVERRQAAHDSFWSWRELMYGFAARIGPDEMRDVARQLYLEMLKSGYTRVCEFHYVHHQPDGTPYADPATMSLALIEAASDVGIGLTLLPVLYMTGGFDGRPLAPRQQRFGLGVDDYLRLLEQLRGLRVDGLNVGIALHSLRAVPPAGLREVLASPLAQDTPIHIHIAEQPAEVDDCMETHGTRPVRWLLGHADVDARWCLVHATHVSDEEVTAMAATGAAVGLCPSTEGNLGDGIFPLAAYLGAGGHIAIGSDANASISPIEELRWLEYGQRLVSGQRHVAAVTSPSVGEALWQGALAGGQRAAGQPPALTRGASADLLVLDDNAPTLAGHDDKTLLDAFVFAGNAPLVRDVMVAGRWRVRDFHHPDEARIAAAYRRALARLLES